MTKKGNKYHAEKVTFRGETFDSRKELKRYLYLQQLQRDGVIGQLHRQVRFMIIPPTSVWETVQYAKKTVLKPRLIERAAYYTCDFVYRENGKIVIEDVKSAATKSKQDYILRRKLIVKRIVEHNQQRNIITFQFRET